MISLPFFREKLALGLDIGSSGVKLVQLRQHRRDGEVVHSLQSFGMKPLPPETIVDGALMNSSAIVQAVQELADQLRVRRRDVAIGVSGHSVIIKKIGMPRMTQDELQEAIQWEAEQHIPFDMKDVNIDTQILSGGDSLSTQMEVLLVAAKKDMINDFTSVVSEAGLNPVVVDVDAFAVQNCFFANYDIPANETVVLINAGAAVININIITNGVTTFTRDITTGGITFTEEIQKHLNVSYDEAEALKVGGARSGDTDALVPQEAEKVIAQVAEQVTGEIQRSLDFYSGTTSDSRISRVFISGGTARVPALFRNIESRVGVPVEILNPFKRIEIDANKFDPNFIMEVAPQTTVAVGLALRRPGDKGE